PDQAQPQPPNAQAHQPHDAQPEPDASFLASSEGSPLLFVSSQMQTL
ncbi:hypothetical protein A2U01_0058703, partial [Trifolium medium]|nr:hypothetical protein [Trifolium medium]